MNWRLILSLTSLSALLLVSCLTKDEPKTKVNRYNYTININKPMGVEVDSVHVDVTINGKLVQSQGYTGVEIADDKLTVVIDAKPDDEVDVAYRVYNDGVLLGRDDYSFTGESFDSTRAAQNDISLEMIGGTSSAVGSVSSSVVVASSSQGESSSAVSSSSVASSSSAVGSSSSVSSAAGSSSSTVSLSSSAESSSSVSVPSNGLVRYYPFNGNANDESGNGGNATQITATLATDRFGNAGSAYSFDGIGDQITTPYTSAINFSANECSFSVWVKPRGNNTRPHFFGHRGGSTSIEGELTSTHAVRVVVDNAEIYSTPSTITTEEWHHIVMIWDAPIISLYIDGQFIGQVTDGGASDATNTNALIIGHLDAFAENFRFEGEIDDFRVYDRPLTDTEVSVLFAEDGWTGNPSSSSSGSSSSFATFTDTRDSRIYKKVTIGSQVWMAENLDFDTLDGNGSSCRPDDTDCSMYGRRYTWTALMAGELSSYTDPSGVRGVCPFGWHLPSNIEWRVLDVALGMTQGEADASFGPRGSPAGNKMKSVSWDGTNESGFSALVPGGMWAATEASWSTPHAWYTYLTTGSGDVTHDVFEKDAYELPARCVAN